MSESKDTELLEQRSRALFEEQVVNQDAHTRSRLNQARQAALNAARGEARIPWSQRWLLPVGSAAALALVFTTVQVMRPAAEPTMMLSEGLTGSVDDVEILTAEADLDLLQNMDFYAWVAAQPEGAGEERAAGEAG